MAAVDSVLSSLRTRLPEAGLSEGVQKAWIYWARVFLGRFPERRPESLVGEDLELFLRQLAQKEEFDAAARRLAQDACVFLLGEVLGVHDAALDRIVEGAHQGKTPVLLTPAQVNQLLDELSGSHWLIASLVYGAGLRLLECVRLRVRDLKNNRVVVCDASGRACRETVLPGRVREAMRLHLEQLKLQHIRELADGFGGAQLPLGMRAPASTSRAWVWQFLFPGPYLSEPTRRAAPALRAHTPEMEVRQAIEHAARLAGLPAAVSANTLRNSFAAHLLQRGVALADVERLLGVEPRSRQPDARDVQPAPQRSRAAAC